MERGFPLLSLAVDLLKEIVERLYGGDLGRLWLCGSSRLIWLLSEGALVQDIEFNESSSSLSLSWPTFLSYLPKIQHIKVNYGHYHYATAVTKQNLLALPKNLKSLEIQQLGCCEALTELLNEHASHFQELERLSLHGMISNWKNRFSANVKLGKNLPSTLQSLTLNLPQLDPHKWTEHRFDILSLPPTLTELCLISHHFKEGTITQSWPPGFKLPPTLTKFSHYQHGIDPRQDWIPILNDGLLHFSGSFNVPVTRDMWSKLPRSLTYLKASLLNWTLEDFLITTLPASITVLSLQTQSNYDDNIVNYLQMLPKNIKECDLGRDVSIAIGARIAENLPRSLTTLKYYCDYESLPFLPAGLQSLKFSGVPSPGYVLPSLAYNPSVMGTSANSLASPSPHAEPSSLQDHPFKLPVNLTSIIHGRILALPDAIMISKLKNLTSMEVGDLSDSDTTSLLPKTLRMLKINSFSPTKGAALSKLPSHLTFLKISKNKELFPLPSHSGDSSNSNQGSSASVTTQTLPSEFSSWLPRGLRELVLEGMFVETGWPRDLPSSLQRLSLCVNLTLSDAKQLSLACPHLEQLHMRSTALNPSEVELFGHLPPSIRSLTVFLSHSPGARSFKLGLSRLPPRLLHLNLTGFKILEDFKEILPTSLLSLVVNFTEPKWFLPPRSRRASPNPIPAPAPTIALPAAAAASSSEAWKVGTKPKR